MLVIKCLFVPKTKMGSKARLPALAVGSPRLAPSLGFCASSTAARWQAEAKVSRCKGSSCLRSPESSETTYARPLRFCK